MADVSKDTFQTLNYPSNSNRPKPAQRERIEKVAEGPVTQKKKPLSKRFVETFFGESLHDLPRYVVLDVFLPGLRDGIFDVISYLLYPNTKRPYRPTSYNNITRVNGSQMTSYNAVSRQVNQPRVVDSLPDDRGDILFINKFDAEKVLEKLREYLAEYGQVTIGDFYDAAGVTTDPTCYKRGWTNLDTAKVTHVRDGWILYLPPEGRVD